MTAFVIEVNDYELRAAKLGEVLTTSPGYAALLNGQVTLGSAALAIAQSQPRAIENRYWRDLNTAPIEHLGKRVRHHADLAWLQLEQLRQQIGNPQEAVFAVPGSMSHAQLALLSGIAQSCQLRPVGLVDSAVAAGAAALGPGAWTHLDLQQHQAVLTRLDITDQVTRQAVEVLPGFGVNRLRQICVRVIAAAFVAQCRFDPLVQANTEQLLYAQLTASLGVLKTQSELNVVLDYRGKHLEARVPRLAILEAVAPLLRTLREAVPAHSAPVASHRLASQLGYADFFAQVPVLSPRAVFQGLKLTQWPSGGLQLLTELPASTAPSVMLQAPAVASPETPTHLLEHTTALPFSAHAWYLLPRGDMVRSAEAGALASVCQRGQQVELTPMPASRVLLNGRAVGAAAVLHAGDQITVAGAGVIFTAIRVIGADAA